MSLTEKATQEKVSLLVQKNLYGAAISMAYADPSYEPTEITALYRRHAEHLYRKGDFGAAMDQYIFTIGSLESSHVIFRFLDAPKIPLLAKYLEELRTRGLATAVHNDLLRTCYLKLNDSEAAEKIAASTTRTTDASASVSLIATLTDNPQDALATVCSMEAPQVRGYSVCSCHNPIHSPAFLRLPKLWWSMELLLPGLYLGKRLVLLLLSVWVPTPPMRLLTLQRKPLPRRRSC